MLHIALMIFGLYSAEAAGTCKVLAIGGGSDKAAYTAGAIIGLIDNLGSSESQWDVVTGNGDGAINAYIVAQRSKGEESKAATDLKDFWTNFSYSDFYEDWSGWYVTGLFFESGLYDAKNLEKTIEKLNIGDFHRYIGVGATDLLTGGYVFFNSSLSMNAMKTGVKASASTAGIFPIVDYQSFKLVDGTIKFSVDILHGIDQCNAKGFKDEDIVIDVVLSAGKTMRQIDASGYRTLQVLLRYLAIASYDGTMQVIENAEHDHPGIKVRSKVFPSEGLPDSLYPFDYSSREIQEMMDIGIKDAANALK